MQFRREECRELVSSLPLVVKKICGETLISNKIVGVNKDVVVVSNNAATTGY